MSNARNLANLLGTNTLIQASNINLGDTFAFTGTVSGTDGNWVATSSQIGTPDAATETQTGIPSTAREVLMVWDNVAQSVASPDPFLVRLGTSGGVKTSGYKTMSTWQYDPSNINSVNPFTDSVVNIGNWGSGSKWSGFFYFWNSTGDQWVYRAEFEDSTGSYDTMMIYQGTVDMGGTLDRIEISVGSGTLNAGDISVYYK